MLVSFEFIIENFIPFVTEFGVKGEGKKKNHQIGGEIAKGLNRRGSTNYRNIEKRREWVVNVVFFVFLK